jgi:hypothetical protein
MTEIPLGMEPAGKSVLISGPITVPGWSSLDMTALGRQEWED